MTTSPRLLHLAKRQPDPRLFTPAFVRTLHSLGAFDLVTDADQWTEDEVAARIRACDVLLTGWGHVAVPVSVAAEPGDLHYICHLTGTLVGIVPAEVVTSGVVPVTNWGDAPAFEVAEAAFTLLLACLKNLRPHIDTKRAENGEGWRLTGEQVRTLGTVRQLRLGLYGCGVIGRAFIDLCRPFAPKVIRAFDPYAAELPDGVTRTESLAELFAQSDAVVIHAGLTDTTRGSVSGELLARLPDGGVLINTARGGIVDQEALWRELESGRLRAGLDVLDGDDRLPPEHPMRACPNLILTAHQAATHPWPPLGENELNDYQIVARDNLQRFVAEEPLRFVMDASRYALST